MTTHDPRLAAAAAFAVAFTALLVLATLWILSGVAREWWRDRRRCRHELRGVDLTSHEADPPGTRVTRWPCHKCGEVFYGDCGLGIANRTGAKIVGPWFEDPEEDDPE